MNIPELRTEEWIEVLEPFHQEIIKELLLNNSEETDMELSLTVSGPEHTSSYGATGKNHYLKALKK